MLCPKCRREIPDDSNICCYCGRVIHRLEPRPRKRPNGSGSVYKLTDKRRTRPWVMAKGGKILGRYATKTAAQEALEKLTKANLRFVVSVAKQYQNQVDAKFAEVEALYDTYMNQKASLSAATRQTRENAILIKEKDAQTYQESLFGNEGTLMKKRVEVIAPIQKKVFAAIEAYAKQVGADVVIDSANNPTLLYTNPGVERTQQVIDALKK